MDKIYRVRQGMGGRYVVERDGAFRWLEGDVFGDYRPGGEVDGPLGELLSLARDTRARATGSATFGRSPAAPAA